MPAQSPHDAVPLSQADLWRAQKQFYARATPDVFKSGTLPYHVTSNPAIAHAYAQLIAAWARDLGTGPLTVLEIGPGSGRFAYLLLSELKRVSPGAADRPSLQYVCADVSQALLHGIRSHPANQEHVRSGTLQFALLDADRPGELLPCGDGNPVRLDGHGAMVVVANYVFDSLAQDAFYISRQQLWQTLARVSAADTPAGGVEPVSRWHVSFEQRPAPRPYYGDTELDAVLEHFAATHEGALLFPVAGLRLLRHLKHLSAGRPLLVLVADKGCAPGVPATQTPHLEFHGEHCFSMSVNFEAFEQFWRPCGVLKRDESVELLSLRVFHSGRAEGGRHDLEAAFEEYVVRSAPDDWFLWSLRIGRDVQSYSLAEMMAALRMSGYDPSVLNDCFTMMFRLLPSAAAHERAQLRRILRRVVDNYFFVGETPDIAFEAGSLLYAIGDHEEALARLRQSESLSGPLPATLFQQARCLYHLGEKEAALATLRACLASSGDFEQFLMLAGVLERPVAREFEQQLTWELSLGDIDESRQRPNQ